MAIRETDLFEPVKYYLEKQGYTVRSEVRFCDITATRDDELVIVELKTKFSVNLLMQAVRRQEVADSVYIAIAVPVDKVYPSNFKGICRLCRRLELGLILVNFLKTKTKLELIFHPTEYTKRRHHKRRQFIIREIDGRYRNFNRAGSTSQEEKITAYKQAVIQVACYLDLLGTASPAKLKQLGTGKRTNTILAANHYGWFDKIDRGVYTLHDQGRKALERYPEIVNHFKEEFNKQFKTGKN